MRRRFSRARGLLLLLAMGVGAACGKRGDPLAPYLKTPAPATGFDVSQLGDEVEIRVTAPRTTMDGRPLPVIRLEWFQGPPTGDFGKGAVSLLREEVAPGELRIKRFPRPAADVRFGVRASSGKARSAQGLVLFKPAPVPTPPEALELTNTATGVELRWTNPPGAEPWPTPSPSPSPSPTPVPGTSPVPGSSPTLSPAAPPSPSPTADPPPVTKPGAEPRPLVPGALPVVAQAGGSPTPTPTPPPTPSPTPPTGIRIFRTDGVPRLARDQLQASTWLDPSPRPGDKPCYSLRYATSFRPLVESAPTDPVCVEVKDIVRPDPPGRLVGDVGVTFVELSWLASPSVDVAFYRIYRALDTSPRSAAIETQGPVLRIRDPNMTPGPRAYEVVAVDQGGNESEPTALLKLIVP